MRKQRGDPDEIEFSSGLELLWIGVRRQTRHAEFARDERQCIDLQFGREQIFAWHNKTEKTQQSSIPTRKIQHADLITVAVEKKRLDLSHRAELLQRDIEILALRRACILVMMQRVREHLIVGMDRRVEVPGLDFSVQLRAA